MKGPFHFVALDSPSLSERILFSYRDSLYNTFRNCDAPPLDGSVVFLSCNGKTLRLSLFQYGMGHSPG